MPLPREELEEMIRAGLAEADDEVVAAWQRMRMEPELWRCRGEHVWVIAMRDGAAVWYDEVEEGFLAVPFAERGVLDPQWTSQDDFADFLRKLPEGRAEEAHAGARVDTDVPVTLRDGGVIVKWQTTSCTVHARGGASWRIRGAGRVETRRAAPEFTGAELVATHPILDDHDAPQAELYVSSVAREDVVSRALGARVHAATAGWRTFASYVNHLDVLAGGHGLLMRGPKPIALACAETLAALGVRHNVLDAWTPKQRHVALILGENFIVAESFRFDPT